MTAVRTNDNKKNEFHHQLDALQDKIKFLHLDPTVEHTLETKAKKILGNVLLFDNNRLYLYKTIKTDLSELTADVDKYEREFIRKSLEKNPAQSPNHDAIMQSFELQAPDIVEAVSPPKPAQAVKLDTKKTSSTCFSLMSFFSCFGGHKTKHHETAKQPNYQTFKKEEQQTAKQPIKTPSSHKSTLSSGLSYLSSLFCCCFGRRKHSGYQPIPTESPNVIRHNIR